MNTDKPSYKKARRPSVSVTDLVAQIAGQVAHEQVQKLENELTDRLNNYELSRGSVNYAALCKEIAELKAMQSTNSVAYILCDTLDRGVHKKIQALREEVLKQVPDIKVIKARLEEDLRIAVRGVRNEIRECRIANTKHADVQRVQNSLQRKGFAWPPAEDKQLEDELRTALETIAANHGRSAHGIRCRIQDKNLVKEIQL